MDRKDYYNAGKTYDERVKNAFTAYLLRGALREQERCAFRYRRARAMLMNQVESELFENGVVNFRALETVPDKECHPSSWQDVMRNLDSQKLYRVLRKLTDEEANILFLHVILDLSYMEIERIIKTPAEQAQLRYTVTIRKIRRAMEREKNK